MRDFAEDEGIEILVADPTARALETMPSMLVVSMTREK
jgi:hypothetical protein